MKVLVIAPHGDDEILGVGGTIARFVNEGSQVFICIVTTGQQSMFPIEMINKLRKEVQESHNMLGIVKTFFLELPAVLLSEVPRHIINREIDNILTLVQPDICFIPHFGDMHLDHFIVSQASMVGLRPIKVHKVLEVYSYETLSETEWNVPHVANAFIPNVFIDISEYISMKIKAMECYSSQLKQFPHPRSIEAIASLAALRGATIGVKAAEAFHLIRRIVI